jgi:hypothetical protein
VNAVRDQDDGFKAGIDTDFELDEGKFSHRNTLLR